VIAAGIIAVVVVALGQLGTSSSSARTETQIVTASDGVVQSTVSGTGSLAPVTEEDVDFQTSGTLSHVYVKQGEYVHKGQLLASLGDTTAALTLKQAKATLAEARTTLSSDEANESSSSDTSAAVEDSAVAEDVSYTPTSSTPTHTVPTQTVTTTETVTAPSSASATTPTTATTPATRTIATERTQTTAATTTEPTQTTTTGTSAGSTRTGSDSTGSSSSSGTSTSGSSTSSSTTVTAATVDADKLQVLEDEQTVKEDRQALDQTRLRAPVSGTITSLESIAPGDSVSSGSTSSADSSSASTSTTGSTAVGSSTGSTSSSSSSSSSSFAVIDSLKQLSMTVSFTEADINKLKVGQPAVVTLDALSDLELAGKVTSVSSIGTTSDDVTSYDATVTLNQYDSRVKPGMSASAEVVIKQGHGVTVPSSAVTGSGNLATVTEDVDGKHTTKKVIVGIRGDSRDLIVSGLSSGAELVETETLPSLGSSASTSSSSSSSATGAFSRRSATGAGGGFPSGGFSGAPAGGGAP
jgi:multidrug efflux pump subunit AcrA (membrane-fusion protein)